MPDFPLFGKEHVDRYQATGGQDGYHWVNGTTILLLHTTGRRSGKEYINPLIYRDFGPDYLVVASKGGSDAPPDWFRNLEAHPEATIQVKDEIIPVRARVAAAQEKPDMWSHMVEVWPDYDEYQEKTDREIPVVVLERR
jgi:deazaflavin-dependent oxidoreductase (nitroreductase family)